MKSQTLPIRRLLKLGRFAPARVQRGYRWELRHQFQLLLDLEREIGRAGLDLDPIRGLPHSLPPPVTGEPGVYDEAWMDEVLVATPVKPYEINPASLKRRTPAAERYFLGHMVLGTTGAPDKFDVYDGQQRLTTLVLLLAVLRDRLPPDPDQATIHAHLVLPDGEPRLVAPSPGGTLRRISRTKGGSLVAPHKHDTMADTHLREGAAEFASHIREWSMDKSRTLVSFFV